MRSFLKKTILPKNEKIEKKNIIIIPLPKSTVFRMLNQTNLKSVTEFMVRAKNCSTVLKNKFDKLY